MREGTAVLALEGVAKRYGYQAVLERLDLELRPGELLLLLGPNGAGKTTLTRVLTTLTRPHAGRVLFRGEPVTGRNRSRLLRQVGYLSHQSFLYAHLTAVENLRFFGRLYGVGRLEERTRDTLARVGLKAARDKLVGTFSRGMQQRLSLARVLLTDPEILVLDEPYTGLDPEGSRALTGLLGGLKVDGRALLMVSHQLEEALAIADRVAVLAGGRVAWEAPAGSLDLAALRARYFELVSPERGSP